MPQSSLVTGGAGFIGSHLAAALLERGDRVRILDNLSTGYPANLAGFEQDVELEVGDIRDPAACAQCCRGVDVVYHVGALGSVPRSIEDPTTSHAVNVLGTLNLLVAARNAGVHRFVFSSSSSVYGDQPQPFKHEAMRTNPLSPYAATIVAGEEYCRAFFRSYGLETVSLRYFNVFGPRQDPSSQYAAVIPRFVAAYLEGRRPVIFGDGRQSRDFTYVANVVEANLLAAAAAGVGGEVFNVACGRQISVREIAERIGKALGRGASFEFCPPRPGDIRHSCADIRAAEERLGYRPRVGFGEGLALTIAAYLDSHRAGTLHVPAVTLAASPA